MRLRLLFSLVFLSLTLAACGDDKAKNGDMTDSDLGDANVDMPTDAPDVVDPCTGLQDLCTSEGTTCDGDDLVVCAANADGCLVETSTSCVTGTTDSCDSVTSMCVASDPCEGVSDCDTEDRSCDGSTLVVCAPDANGCLVETETDCIGNGNNSCDASGAVTACTIDPCLAADGTAPADACAMLGTSCNTDTLLTCALDGFGCAKETATDCTAGVTNGTCDDTMTAVCTSDDMCTDECTGPSVMCAGNGLVTCAVGPFGCFVETTEDCSAVTDGFCDTTTSVCAIDTTMRCAGKTLCQGTTEGLTCGMNEELLLCQFDAVGCLVESVIDCGSLGQICRTDMNGAGTCGLACTDHPSCTGSMEGDMTCNGSVLETCSDTNGDSCLNLVPLDCGTQVCDGAAMPPVCINNGTGNSCMDPLIVQGPQFIGGTDFAADFNNSLDLTDASCQPPGAEELILQIPLAAGETVALQQLGSASTAIAMLDTCADTAICSSFVLGSNAFSYTAVTDETVFIIVESTFGTGTYALDISFPVCGDGVTSTGETCDDSNMMADDGCTSCQQDFGFGCDNSGVPSVCTAYPHIGDFNAGDMIMDTTGGPILAGASNFYTITFLTDAILSGSLTAGTTGDLDFFVYDDQGNVILLSNVNGNETFADIDLPAGDYLVEVRVFAPAGDNDTYTLALSTTAVVCGNGVTEGSETCDDGNMVAMDGCDASCQAESGFTCTGQPSLCLAGDGNSCATPLVLPAAGGVFDVDYATATNDDANGWDMGACLVAGFTGPGNDLVYSLDVAPGAQVTVDLVGVAGTLHSIASACATASSTSCLSASSVPGALVYNNASGALETIYIVVDNNGANSGVETLTVTVVNAVCGDGTIEAGEECDDMNLMNMDGCSSSCTVEPGYVCPPPSNSCRLITCGDGFVDGTETCDDGNMNNTDGCSSTCDIEATYFCSGEPSFCHTETGDSCADPIQLPGAGQFSFNNTTATANYTDYLGSCASAPGVQADASEMVFAVDVPAGQLLTVEIAAPYDRAVLVIADSCVDPIAGCVDSDSTGTVPQPIGLRWENLTAATATVYIIADGFFTSSEGNFTLDVDLRTPMCQDGFIDAGEGCDDGNATNNDGCDSTCQVESGSACVGEPSICGTPVSVVSTPMPPLAIPDNNPTGVTDIINVPAMCTVAAVSVDLSITHTYQGDLIVGLTAPDGMTSATLHNRTGGTVNNIVGNYPGTLTPATPLAVFDTINGTGNWTLSISDNANADTGTLDTWTLTLICQ